MRLPRGYDDLGRVTPIGALADVADGTVVLVRGTVRRLHVFPRRLLDVIVEEDGASVRARWFRAHASMAKAFVKGNAVALAGPVRTAADGTREMVHPSNVTAALEAAAAPGRQGLGMRPRYGIIEGVKGRTLEAIRASALAVLAPETERRRPSCCRRRRGRGWTCRRSPNRFTGCMRHATRPTSRAARSIARAGGWRWRRCSSRRSRSCGGAPRRVGRRCLFRASWRPASGAAGGGVRFCADGVARARAGRDRRRPGRPGADAAPADR